MPADIFPLELDGLLEIRSRRFEDERGFFEETWRSTWFGDGAEFEFVQDNHSYSSRKGTVRGLHFQLPPFAQAKLVRVARGSIFDVAVDVRRSSPTFGKWNSKILSAAAGNMLLIPGGFAHGFVTLEDDCDVEYKVAAEYSPAHERALRFDDPAIGIEWPDLECPLTISARDSAAATLAELFGG